MQLYVPRGPIGITGSGMFGRRGRKIVRRGLAL